MKKTKKFEPDAKFYSKKLIIFDILLFFLFIFLSFLNETLLIIPFFIALICGFYCYKWAKKLNKNEDVAYWIGGLFGLFGLLGYWIYFKIKSK